MCESCSLIHGRLICPLRAAEEKADLLDCILGGRGKFCLNQCRDVVLGCLRR
jgi:hypothetical protein